MRENCQKKLIVIAGPTAVGKTALSVELAGRLGTEIISADSMQVYKGMDIGTAKASVSERKGIPHHMIDICEPGQDFNVYAYQELAGPIIERMQEKGMIPVMCGGTGLYIQSVIYDIDFTEEGSDVNLRKELHELAGKKGNHAVKQILCEVDPESAAVLPDGDLKRIIRAIEYFKVHGEKMSVHKKREAQKLSCPVFDLRFFVLYRKQEELSAVHIAVLCRYEFSGRIERNSFS